MALSKEQFHKILVESGALEEEVFVQAAASAKVHMLGIDGVLIDEDILEDDQIGQLVALWYGVPFVRLSQQAIEKELLARIPETFARRHHIIPLRQEKDHVVVAMCAPDDLILRSLLEKHFRCPVACVYATVRDVQGSLYLFAEDPKIIFERILEEKVSDQKERETGSTKIIDLVNTCFHFASHQGASDIHLEPEEHRTIVRFRVDGILHDIVELPASLHEQMMMRLKVMARLATDIQRQAQDGKIFYKTSLGDAIDVRLSLVPTTRGEKAVMRLLSDQAQQFGLHDLGFSEQDAEKIQEVIERPWGMLLVSGPTGSGKTTTLYAILKVLNTREVNITTIEDPVEYDLENVAQIPVNVKTGLTFAKGLRSIVRQDPDIIMVGEIRDKETAGIAVNAAMTGHIVLSTLHTNDAATAFPRLLDMGAEDFLVASTVNGILAQRLVRKICGRCIESYELDKTQEQFFGRLDLLKDYLKMLTGKTQLSDLRFFRGKGCQVCNGSGYKGRIGIFELLLMSETIRQAVMDGRSAEEIKQLAIKEGMTTMLYDGLRKVLIAQTTLEEVLRVTRE